MVTKLIEACIRNRLFVLIVAAAVSFGGAWALMRTPVDAIPDLSDVQVIVYTEYSGQAPQVVEDQVTYPLTTAMLAVPHAKTVRGYSFFGFSMVYVIFEDGTDLYWARSRVLEYLNFARGRLPAGLSPQLGPDATGVGWIYEYTLSDFSPRTGVLKAQLDADGNGMVDEAELPAIPAAELAAADREQRAAVYPEKTLLELFAVAEHPGIGSTLAFAEESVRYLKKGFDEDRDEGISKQELYLAANFAGIDLANLRSLQDWYLRYELMAIPGVSEVASAGGYVRQYQIEVDPEKLRAHGLTLGKIKQAVQRSNLDVGGRLVELGETEFMVRGKGYISSLDDLKVVPVGMDPATHTPIYLSQVADIHLGPELRRGIMEMNGQGEVVSGIVLVRFGENALEVIERVKTRMAELEPGLPAGVEVHVSYDRSALIHRAVDTLTTKLLEEMLVVALICILFLLHFRSAFVAIITLPVGILMSFIVMNLLGISANIMSLGGIAIAIGVMVDASVVMVENLHKHKERNDGRSHLQTVIDASVEVGPALFFSLLIVTVSFLPVFALEAQEGRMFRPLAYTKTFAMASSAIVAVTLIPVLMVFFVRGKIRTEAQNPISRFFIAAYRPIIRAVLRFPAATIAISLLLLGLTLWPYSRLGSEFMPPLNEGDILYMPTTPPGISITKAKELLQQTDKLIATHPQVAHVLGKIGRAETATDPAPLSMIETTILLTPKETWPEGKTIEDIAAELDQRVKIPGLTNAWTMPIKTRIDMLATGIKTPVGVKLLGDDLTQLSAIGTEIEGLLRGLPDTRSVYSERVVGGNYLDVDIDREKAARFGLTVADVQEVVASAIGGMNVTYTVEGLERYPVNLRYPRELRSDLSALRELAVPTPMGHAVPLGSVATLSTRKGPPAIKSENARRTAWIFVDLKTSDVGGYVKEARELVRKEIDLPDGVSIQWSGQFEYMEHAKETLSGVIPLTLAIIFLLLYLHFRSITESLIVMATLPFALIGGIWLMWLLDFNLSVAVGVGFIALAGLAAETGVVMLVYLDEAFTRWKREGRLKTLADLSGPILEGAVDRVRPKLMTVATTLIGLLPVMFGTETGTRVMKRIAAPMVGGLVSSTILTLIILPAIYLLWKRLTERKELS
ncbi:MAG: CusA/CzcA family heavy metal efflux RND transporter [Deltaproteobacteria bacterium]|nr:CusA/CzcA family heavy metal efflux RND transporter [Deltaproteobacteria bacterium]